jgi:ABC-type phosphate transport system substrate-binding protein
MFGFRRTLAKTGARASLLAIAVLAVLAVSGVGASSASAACTGGEIKGEGSTLQTIAQEEVWKPSFESTCAGHEAEFPKLGAWGAVGSGKGLEAWRFTGAGAIKTEFDFIGTDDAPSGAQIANAELVSNGAKVAVVPVAQTAIAVVYHLPTGCELKKGFTNANLTEIFSGKIENWSQLTNVQKTGGGACSFTLKRVVRKEGSGTTFQFKNYLSEINNTTCAGEPKWTELEEVETPNVTWPECAPTLKMAPIAVEKGSGLAKKVKEEEGTVGYAALPDAKGQNATVAKVQNGTSGETLTYASPESEVEGKGAANCAEAVYKVPGEKGGIDKDWSKVFGGNPKIGGEAYSICTLTYDLAWEGYEKIGGGFTKTIGEHVHKFITHILGNRGVLDKSGKWYRSLPETKSNATNVQKAAEETAALVG